MKQEQRPNIYDICSGADLQRWYWLKADLVAYCKALDLPYTGSKAEITERLAHFLDTGVITQPKRQRCKCKSGVGRGLSSRSRPPNGATPPQDLHPAEAARPAIDTAVRRNAGGTELASPRGVEPLFPA